MDGKTLCGENLINCSIGNVLSRRQVIIGAAASMATIGHSCGTPVRGKTDSNPNPVPGRSKNPFAQRKGGAIKRQAISDYAFNMQAFGGRLASTIDQLLRPPLRPTPWLFDVVIVQLRQANHT